MDGFDFGFLPEGEIIVNNETHDIHKSSNNELRVQLAYNRIKSISNDWFIDNIGADLEELVGRPCTKATVDLGKEKIIQALTFDNLWNIDEILVKAEIKNNTNVTYTIYLKLYVEEQDKTYSYEIHTTLDLVKGVFVHYGWNPRR